jgi:hypothetical protein
MFNCIQFAHMQYARAHESVQSEDVGWLAGGRLLLDFGLRISIWFPSTSLKSWFLFFGDAGVWAWFWFWNWSYSVPEVGSSLGLSICFLGYE